MGGWGMNTNWSRRGGTRHGAMFVTTLGIVALGPVAILSYGPVHQALLGLAPATGSSNLSVEMSYQEVGGTGNSSGGSTGQSSGFSVQLGAVVSGGTAPYTASWAYGDGTYGSGLTVLHNYSTAGPACFNGTLQVLDAVGDTGSQIFQANVRTGGIAAGTSMNGTTLPSCSGGSTAPGGTNNSSGSGATSSYSLTYPYSGSWGKPGGWSPCNGHHQSYSSTVTSWGGLGADIYSESDQSNCQSNTGEQTVNDGFWYCSNGNGNTATCPQAWKSGTSGYTLTSNFTFEPFCVGGCQNDYINTVVSYYSGGGCHGHALNSAYFTLAVWDLSANSNVLFKSQSFPHSNDSYSYGCSGGYQGLPHPGGPNLAWVNFSVTGSFQVAYGDVLVPRAGFVSTAFSTDNYSGCWSACSGYAKSLVGYDEYCFLWGGYIGCSGVFVLSSFWLR